MLLDYELIGDLQVSNGIVSGFNNSTNNYIKIPYSLPMGSNKVEVCISVYFPAFTSGSVILANYNDSSSGGGLALRTDGVYDNLKYWSWDSSGTLLAEGIDLGFDLTVGTNIIKFVYENSTITWYKSTDGTSFTQGVSRSGTIADFQNYIAIGASGTVWSSGNMQVNMLDSYIKVNDEYWHSKEYIKQKTRIIQRHDTVINWSTVNPVLALGEMGVETDTNKFKFGDGTTPYNELPYAAGEGGGTGGSGTTITSKDGTTSYNKLALGDGLIVGTGDIPWTNPQMSSNSQDGYILTSSANNTSDGKSNMYRAFDKDTTTPDYCWYTGSVSMPQWIMLECPEPIRVTSCMIKNEVYTPVNFKSGYIQGSNDGSSFDTLYAISNRANTTGLVETYTFENSKYYKYLRVYCTESYGSGLSIQEIEFKGFVKSTVATPTLNAKVDSYTKEETDNLLLDKQDKLTAGNGVSIQLEGEEYELTSTFPKNLINNSVKLLENINTDYGVYMTLHCVNDNPPNFDIHLLNRTDGAYSTCGYIIYTSNGYITAATIKDGSFQNEYVTNIPASDASNIYIKMSIKPTTGYGTLEISTDNINFITVQEGTQPNLLNAQCWFKTSGVLTVNSVYAYKFPVSNYIKAKPDNTTIGFNSSGQLACKSNMLSDSNFIEYCTANADAIKAALGLS